MRVAVGGLDGDETPRSRHERFRAAFQALSPDQRKVIVLIRLQGIPLKEVAKRMGRTPSAVATILHRASRRIRKNLGDYFDS